MGVYITEGFSMEGKYLVQTEDWGDGAITKTYYEPVLEIVSRDQCFCCSCDDDGSDHLCRNHGVGYGTRPCEVHEMPGDTEIGWHSTLHEQYAEEYDTGIMPHSVQWERFVQDWRKQRWVEPIDRRCVGQMIQNMCPQQLPHSHWPQAS